MTTKHEGPGTIKIEGESYATVTFKNGDEWLTVRELSVDEGDDAAEMATGPDGKINNRLNTRLLLAKAITDPPTTVDQVGKFGSRKFMLVLRHFNVLNSLPEANPTSPAGSAEPTSPGGGEPSPAI